MMIIMTLSIKFVYMLQIQIKQNINILFKARKKIGLRHHKNPKALIEYSNNIQDIYKNIDQYNPEKDDMIATLHVKKLQEIVTELFIRVY